MNMTPSDSEAELRWLKAPDLELSAASAKFANWFQNFSSLLNCSKRTFLSKICPTLATREQPYTKKDAELKVWNIPEKAQRSFWIPVS